MTLKVCSFLLFSASVTVVAADLVAIPRSTEPFEQIVEKSEIDRVSSEWQQLKDSAKCQAVVFKFNNVTVIHNPKNKRTPDSIFSSRGAQSKLSSLITGNDTINVMKVDQDFPDDEFSENEIIHEQVERARKARLLDCDSI